MKDLKALFAEIKGSEELQAKFPDALKNGWLADFLKENGCDAGADEVLATLKKTAEAGKDESMSPDDMDAVAGGTISRDTIRMAIEAIAKYNGMTYEEYTRKQFVSLNDTPVAYS